MPSNLLTVAELIINISHNLKKKKGASRMPQLVKVLDAKSDPCDQKEKGGK